MRCVAVADIDLEKAVACVREFGVEHQVCGSQAQVNETIDRGVVAVCEDGDLVARAQPMDALIESTSAISAAGEFAVSATESGKHLILMNAEVDWDRSRFDFSAYAKAFECSSGHQVGS